MRVLPVLGMAHGLRVHSTPRFLVSFTEDPFQVEFIPGDEGEEHGAQIHLDD